MIPHFLQIKNFLSYGANPQTISFDPYNLICFSGKNGHGKSALLDAITWAIWGQARKTITSVKPDQGLLRLGQNQMMVMLEFSCNKQRYRIRREYMYMHNKPYAQLEFGLIDHNNILIPLTDKTIKATQEIIESTLNLTYDSFVNSVFLRQGNANEFSKKSAKERKEILASILGLDQYDIIRRGALQKIKYAQNEIVTLQTFVSKIEQELPIYNTIENQYDEINKALVIIDQEIATSMQQRALIDEQKHIHTIRTQQAAFIFQKQQEYQHFYQSKVQELNTARNLIKQLRQQNKQVHSRDELIAKKEALVEIVIQQQHYLQNHLQYKEEILALRQQLNTIVQDYKQQQIIKKEVPESAVRQLEQERLGIDMQLNLIISQRTKLEAEQNNLKIYEQNLHEEINAGSAIEQALVVQEQQLEKRKEVYQRLIAQGNWLKNELATLNTKNSMTTDLMSPSCPLCEQNLSAARKKFLRIKFERTQKGIEHRLRRITHILPVLKKLLLAQHETITLLKKENEYRTIKIHSLQELYEKIKNIEQQLYSINEQYHPLIERTQLIVRAIEEQKICLASYDTHSLPFDDHYRNAEQQLIHKEQLMLTIAYDASKHQDAMHQINNIQKLLDAHTQKNIIQQMALLANDIAAIIKNMREIKKKIINHTQELTAFVDLEEMSKKLIHDDKYWQEQQASFKQHRESLITTAAQLQADLKKKESLHNELLKIQQHINILSDTIFDYTAIAQATGKDGVQALLIEDAIPEIESEANELLSKLTNNQAQIFIESLKDLKSGGTKETLDIKISDTSGIRPYEMFSGGEAFRIDFALRIAISKLLARKAGTALQTLIIDEGFGSQDEDGLGHITDALYKIQHDFAKIIIVSHLPSIKDQFPVHFVIEKGPHGSTVNVIESE